MKIYVVGRFPPPLDGQSIATERLAALLEADADVHRVDVEPAHSGDDAALHPVRRSARFLRLRPAIRRALADDPFATVFWPAISPDVPGHYRDLLIVAPAFRPSQSVYAIVHRGNFDELFKSRLTAATAMRLAGRIQGFVFLSEHLAERCAAWIPRSKRFVIPNTIDEHLRFSEDEVRRKRQDRSRRTRLRLLFVGHMLRSKGYVDVLDALHILRGRGLDVTGRFAGGWIEKSDREAFRERVTEKGLGDAVTHHGPVHSRRFMKSLYQEADVVLLPTYYRNEAQPLVILEALNAGIPVVTTPHAGIPEMVRNEEEGLFVPARSPNDLAAAVARLNDADLWQRMSRSARSTYVDRFAPEKVRVLWQRLARNETLAT